MDAEVEQECSEEYVKGGYHCVQIGDTFYRNRYKVIRKLGFGAFSTVWLCFDHKHRDYVAIKIVKSKKCFRESALQEINTLSGIQSADPNHPFVHKVVTLLNHFSIRGVNGKHICLVLEVLGDSLFKFMSTSFKTGIPVQCLKSIIRQVLQGLEYLHTKCDLIHTDIKPENILLITNKEKVKRMHSEVMSLIRICDEKQLPNSFVAMAPTAVQHNCYDFQNKTNSILNILKNEDLNQMEVKSFDENLSEIYVKIADLGNATSISQSDGQTIQTRPYRSPEVILGLGYGPSADIWSIACTTFELATGDVLFDLNHKSSPYYSKNEEHLAKMMQLFGSIPMSCKKGKYYKYFNKSDRLLRHKVLAKSSVERLLIEDYGWHSTQAHDLTQFLEPMLRIDARKRPTASECLSHPWINT